MPWNTITGLFAEYGALLSWLGGLSLLMFVGSLIAVPMVIVRLPEDYLRRDHKLLQDWPLHFSVPFLILKNGLGILFLISGLVMLILPGQGLLTLFIGLAMVDFPGKQILVRRTLGHKRILPVVNRLRMRLGKSEFEAPPIKSSRTAAKP